MSRPSFTSAWSAAERIYNKSNSGAQVASVIGGNVALNVNSTGPGKWVNTCAVRMSYILNECGVKIPAMKGETVSGKDKRQYFFRVPNLLVFLRQRWGKPEMTITPPCESSKMMGRKGLIVFEVASWRDAVGHASLYDGAQCYDEAYFSDSPRAPQTTKVHLWLLPD